MHKKIKARLFQLPAIILFVLIPVIATFYIKIADVQIQGKSISWFTPIIVLLVAAAYFYGRYVENKNEFDY